MGSFIRNGINYSGGGSVSTDTTLTKLGTPADAKAVGDRLTASDNTPFRFGVTADGKYGYIIKDGSGADTVIPFSNKDELYEALQYSGLVTEDMTYEEMLDALKVHFPGAFDLMLDEVSDYSQSSTGSNAGKSFTKNDAGEFEFYLKSPDWSSNWLHWYIDKIETIDLTSYSKLVIEGTKTASGAQFYIKILDSSTQTEVATQEISSGTFSHEIDISSININCTIRLYGYSGTANGYFNVTVSKLKLIV